MRLGVVSDLHLAPHAAGPASWHGPYDFAGLRDRLDEAREAFERAGVDAVVACGDLAHAGDEVSVREAFARLAAGGAGPVLAVAGNHDCAQRDDQLARGLGERCRLLTATGVELGGARVAGVGIEREPDTDRFRWTGAGALAAEAPVHVVASHFPVLSRAERLAERGLAYPGDLLGRRALHQRLRGGGPVVVLSGHIHARESHARGAVLQLSAGALIEAPYEVAVVDVEPAGAAVRVRRRVHVLGPPPAAGAPVLAPADETWTYAGGGWRA